MNSLTVTEVESSAIERIGYEKIQECLYVQFRKNGDIWRYLGVGPECHQELLTANSMGRFFARRIRGQFEQEKLNEAEKEDFLKRAIGKTSEEIHESLRAAAAEWIDGLRTTSDAVRF